ncbi:MAG: hypothetical protein ACM30H_12210 [Clostridia bacterium]
MKRMTRIAAALALALWALASLAQGLQTTYRCVGKDGKKYYGSTIPTPCLGQPIEQLSTQGTVIRRILPQASEEEREAKEAEAAQKREADKETKEQDRRNRALLATYTSEKDIEDARGRALDENEKAIKAVEVRIADIKKRQAGFEKEMEFYKEPAAKPNDKSGKKPEAKKPGPKAPPKLLEDIHQADVDLQAQQNLLDSKKKEVEAINAKYDEDKKRYLELTKPAKKK